MGRLGRLTVAAIGVAAFAVAALTSASVGASESQIAIKVSGPAKQSSDLNFRGRFRLELDGIVFDSGLSAIVPQLGATRNVDGQRQGMLVGNDNLTSAKGTLSVSFRGTSIPVNGGDYYAEFGVWHIQGGTGAYRGWKGGGRWASVDTPSIINVEWDGHVTQ